MIRSKHTHEKGEISGLQVTVIGLAVLVLGLGAFGIWSFVNYQTAQQDVDSKIAVAVAEGKNEQQSADDEKFAERMKEPLKIFKGPDDYCGISFNYPKTWSAHIAKDIKNGGTFEAYLNPDVVPVIDNDSQYALRVTIEQKDYDQILKQYEQKIAKNELRRTSTGSSDIPSTRLDGAFDKQISGSAVIYKCNAYTITLRTDAVSTWKKDFETAIRTFAVK
ncbi:hypothetical protein EON76_05855 [bacterium]|nr:MAG: hypothetical protein EON76_05855 [bacterium]